MTIMTILTKTIEIIRRFKKLKKKTFVINQSNIYGIEQIDTEINYVVSHTIIKYVVYGNKDLSLIELLF